MIMITGIPTAPIRGITGSTDGMTDAIGTAVMTGTTTAAGAVTMTIIIGN